MDRNSLSSIISSAVRNCGFEFYGGPRKNASAIIRKYPAAWLEPLQIVAVEGAREGQISYRIAMQLLEAADRQTVIDPETAWKKLELDALEILGTIAVAEGVTGIGKVEISPSLLSVTNHGEVAMEVECVISTQFCI